MKLKQYISFMLVFLMYYSSTVFASEFYNSDTNEHEINFEFDFVLGDQDNGYSGDFDISYLDDIDFDISYLDDKDFYINYEDDNIIAIIPYSEIFGDTYVGHSISIPGGVVLLYGTWLDDTSWELQVRNVGTATAKNLTASVVMYNEYGKAKFDNRHRPRSIGSLGPKGRIYESFHAGGSEKMHRVTVTVSGRMSTENTDFSVDGEQKR